MRKKDPTNVEEKPVTFEVSEGLDFSLDADVLTEESMTQAVPVPNIQKKISSEKTVKAEVDPNRTYSQYYKPRPQLGSRGGVLGRGAVPKSERKIQFSMTCTQPQKERFADAAQKVGRTLPNFICTAVEEYIENHKL